VDEQLLTEARYAQERLINAERDAAMARAEFGRAVRRLHLHGASLRELAAGLGLSHQRVHQIVAEAGGSRRWTRVRRPGWHPDPALLACTFCGQTKEAVHTLIAGPGVYICGPCVALAANVVSSGQPAATELGTMNAAPAQGAGLTCSFCSKNAEAGGGLVRVPGVTVARTSAAPAICSECLALCGEIIAEERG
jgi:ClpX C4-type zinc finger